MTTKAFEAIEYLAVVGPDRLQRKDCDQMGEANWPSLVANIPGNSILHLQTLLKSIGVQIDADGVFGGNTEEALEQLTGIGDYDVRRGDLAVLARCMVNRLVAGRAPSVEASPKPDLGVVQQVSKEIAADPSKLPVHYKQADPDWKDRMLGATKTIGQVGCAMCCCAMVARHAIGNDLIAPAPRAGQAAAAKIHLDQFLDLNNGYDGNSIYWGKIGEFAAQHGVTLRYDRVRGARDYFDRIRALLDEGVFPLVRISHRRGLHFMLAIRYDPAGNIYVNDPGTRHGDGRTENPDNILQNMKRYKDMKVVGLDFYRVA